MDTDSPGAFLLMPQSGQISRSRLICEVEHGIQVLGVRKSTKPRKSTARGQKGILRFGGVPQNSAYLLFIRTLPCVLCGLHVCSGRKEAALVGQRNWSRKAADETALPMCVNAHRTGINAFRKIRAKFWGIWKLDREAMIAKHQKLAAAAGIEIPAGSIGEGKSCA